MATRSAQIGGTYSTRVSREALGEGENVVLHARDAEADGQHAILSVRNASSAGRHRSADASVALYELYRGIDSAPDYSASPWATAGSLPITTAALDPAPAGTERTYYFALRRRNAWGLLSQNVDEWTITVDDAGAVVTEAPTAPEEILVTPDESGKIRIRATYLYDQDGADRADQWAIYTKVGSDPDPSVDSPTLESLSTGDGVAYLDYTTGSYADGADVHVLVRTRRSDDSTESTNTAAESATADVDGPSAVLRPSIHLGQTATQGQ